MQETPRDILQIYGQKFVDAFRESLLKHNKFSSGVLSQSIIAMPIKFMGQKLLLEIRADEYFDYVNDGVDGWQTKHGSPFSFKKAGKIIPIDGMKKFIAMRGLVPRLKSKESKLTREKQIKGLAFAIGYNVKKKGIKPTHFADEVIESQLKEDMEKALSKSMGRLIQVEISKVIKDGNNNK